MLAWLTQSYIGKLVATFIISMLPVVELRGGIPYGVGFGLDPWVAFAVAVLGNMVPVPFILFFVDKVFEILKRMGGSFAKFAEWLERKAYRNQEKIEKYKVFGLLIFVAIPLPGTGAWTGAMAAGVLGISKKKSILSIFAGVLIAGFIMTAVSYGFTFLF
ncbi:MAG: small multi-drug export protein [Oscillospiraceae bacterium]|nr:small multi-drug export protein [Oscillospiraceae bacterium]